MTTTRPIVDVTVVVPTIAGREDLLARALLSVATQTVEPAEVLVITDHQRQGAWWARNQGAALAKTRWLAWLDDDDELLPGHLELLLAGVLQGKAHLGHEPDLIYSYPNFADSRTGPHPPFRDPLATSHNGRIVQSPIGVPFGPEQERWLRYMGNFIPVTYLVDAALVRRVGGMPPSGGPGKEEDYQLLLRLLDAGARFHHVADRTWIYHVHDANTGGGWKGTGASNQAAFQ